MINKINLDLFTILCLFILGCQYPKQAEKEVYVFPEYHHQYADMLNVNKKNNIITTIIKDTLNTDFELNELSKNNFSVIKLWATWCSPCIASMPEFQDLKNQYSSHKNIRFFTVSIDDSYEYWKKMIAERNWELDHYWAGPSEKSQIYHLTYELSDSMVLATLPNYIILGENGVLKENIITNKDTKEYLKEVVNKLAQ